MPEGGYFLRLLHASGFQGQLIKIGGISLQFRQRWLRQIKLPPTETLTRWERLASSSLRL